MKDNIQGYVLAEVIPGFLKAGNIGNGRIYNNESLKFINEKYVVIENFDGCKVIDLETKEILLTEKVLTIVGDIAVLNNNRLYDLSNRSIINIYNYYFDSCNDKIIVLKNESGKCKLFNTKSKTFINSIYGNNITFLDNGRYALEKNANYTELIDLEDDIILNYFHGEIDLTDNSIMTFIDGLYMIEPYKNLTPDYSDKLEVHGKYGIDKKDRVNIYDLTTDKLVFHKKNKKNEKIDIMGDNVFISGKLSTHIIDLVNHNYNRIPFNNIVMLKNNIIGLKNKNGMFILYDFKRQKIVGSFEYIIYHDVIDDIIILLAEDGNKCYLYDTLRDYLTCLPYSSLDIERFDKNIIAFNSCYEVSTIYAPSVIDKYSMVYDDKKIIDIGLSHDKKDEVVRTRKI